MQEISCTPHAHQEFESNNVSINPTKSLHPLDIQSQETEMNLELLCIKICIIIYVFPPPEFLKAVPFMHLISIFL
ncbi:hypothetical protein EUGRSUZ_H03397 [Eucalyptus grandis]|uniref:Uncharacterized protein n=2 Tax=Eucalyptus grandis TaxID=71139 RepID=A0ACC3JTT9_EUCGR|nr:hypothetical protein EUGRSUZ_H03397 [Eucalyptus grandis]